MQLHFTVNGAQHSIDTDPRERLLDVLREGLGLRGTKYGCGEGECGTCTVILNGRAVNSCLVLAGQAHGAEVLTVEGMADDPIGLRILEGFAEAGAVQCGFCTPGMVVAAQGLLATNPHPSVREIQYGLAGNLCRCTGYVKIIDAVLAASRQLRGLRNQVSANEFAGRSLVSSKTGWSDDTFIRPNSLTEALEILAREGDGVRIIAGGTDVVVKHEHQRKEMRFLDISDLDELRTIAEDGGSVCLGALTRYQDILTSPLLMRWAPALVAAARQFAGVQVRNLATVGGNLVNASPAADGLPPLYALGARVRLRSVAGRRELPVTEFATGPGRTVLRRDELLTEVIIPKQRGHGQPVSFFVKVGPRKAQTIAIASVAFRGWLKDGRLRDVYVALGAVAPTVILAPGTAAILESDSLSEDLILAAAERARQECRPIDDLRGTAAYRRSLVRGLVVKGLLPLLRLGE